MIIDRILVPVDFSPASFAAIDYALSLAQACGAALHVLHVWEPSDEVAGTFLASFARSEAGRKMRRLLEALEDEGVVGEVRARLAAGDPATTILDHAGTYPLIVLGSHGSETRGGLRHRILGGVAERVVRRAACPVITVKSLDDASHSQHAIPSHQPPAEGAHAHA